MFKLAKGTLAMVLRLFDESVTATLLTEVISEFKVPPLVKVPCVWLVGASPVFAILLQAVKSPPEYFCL